VGYFSTGLWNKR